MSVLFSGLSRSACNIRPANCAENKRSLQAGREHWSEGIQLWGTSNKIVRLYTKMMPATFSYSTPADFQAHDLRLISRRASKPQNYRSKLGDHSRCCPCRRRLLRSVDFSDFFSKTGGGRPTCCCHLHAFSFVIGQKRRHLENRTKIIGLGSHAGVRVPKTSAHSLYMRTICSTSPELNASDQRSTPALGILLFISKSRRDYYSAGTTRNKNFHNHRRR